MSHFVRYLNIHENVKSALWLRVRFSISIFLQATMFYFFVLDQIKSNEGDWNKHLSKNLSDPIFRKINEGDQIKKTLDKFIEKLMGPGNKKIDIF